MTHIQFYYWKHFKDKFGQSFEFLTLNLRVSHNVRVRTNHGTYLMWTLRPGAVPLAYYWFHGTPFSLYCNVEELLRVPPSPSVALDLDLALGGQRG